MTLNIYWSDLIFNFSLPLTYKTFNPECAREDTTPSQFFNTVFDSQVIFNKHINAIKRFCISNNSEMC